MERLVLIGFMGSGKSTLGAQLAALERVPFVDLDARLEAEEQRSIAALVAADGEAAFRAAELACLERFVRAAPRACIVATGGGVVETPATHPLLRALGRIVWLQADPAVSVARLRAARASRPFLAAGADWESRWRRREPLYRDLAEHVVDTHPQDIESSLRALRAIYGHASRRDAP